MRSAVVLLLLVAGCTHAEAPSTVASTAERAVTPLATGAVTRFVAIGDQGKGNDKQRAVGKAIGEVCAARGGCAFGILLGDNFYPSGVEGVDDPKWTTHFEQPYAGVPFHFWAVLGNHDYGGNGAGWEYWKSDAQVAYSGKSSKWRMPAHDYAFGEGTVDVAVIDSNAIVWGFGADQERTLPARVQAMQRPWHIVAGHHPYLSNGRHGNAGHYDGIPCPIPIAGDTLCRIPAGTDFKAFFDAHVCGKVDLYLAGHDHNMQDLGEKCGVTLLVSGSGASTTRLAGGNAAHFGSDASGFLLIEAAEKSLSATFFDETGKQLHTRTIQRTAAPE